MTDSQLYERDFYAWANEQAELLRAGRLSEADIGHIAEEIESMGKTEKRELVSRLTVLLLHLLKWQFQPSHRGASWRASINNCRDDIIDHLADNPSLKPQLGAALIAAYRRARRQAAAETGLDEAVFPTDCPWTFGEATDEAFWPEA
ncbi:DUF29 domain-containing protein [Acidisoma cladoniae]|jgi:hypothetical protein|uniref:DUF29 domain-containing protein n=1 Tax=Acidisoma cladoniae TaxID=3040935 RepID=UPI00254E52DB|nr:DUF29 domain-containing protein [Acidisoma sp. PAMC 29798]